MDAGIVYIITAVSGLSGIGVGVAAVDSIIRGRMKSVAEQEISNHRIECPFPASSRREMETAIAQLREDARKEMEYRREDMVYVRGRLDWIVGKLRNGGPA